jgi:hypothetical protein
VAWGFGFWALISPLTTARCISSGAAVPLKRFELAICGWRKLISAWMPACLQVKN